MLTVKCIRSASTCLPTCPHKEPHPEREYSNGSCRDKGHCVCRGYIKSWCVPESSWARLQVGEEPKTP